MKTLKILASLSAVMFLMLSCSRTDDYSENLSGPDLKTHKTASAVFIVEPDGADDTPALYQAFEEAKAAGPGSVVQLVEGEYHVGYMEIRDFYGCLKGAGKGKTVITVLPGMNLEELFAQHLLHCNMKFIGGDVNLSHFTMQTPEGQISVGWPYMGHIYALLNFSSFSANYELGNESRSVNVVIDNVNFRGHLLEGGPGYFNGYNCMMAIRAGFDCFPTTWTGPQLPREIINFEITNCEFDTFCYGLGLEGIRDSRITVGGKNEGNIFNNLDMQGGVWESRGVEILVEGNTYNVPESHWGFDIDDYYSYGILREDQSSRTTLCNIQHNVFNLPNGSYGLGLYNYLQYSTGENPIAYQVKNNQFNIKDYPISVYSYFTKGAVIRNNRFIGYGYIGLVLGNYSEGGLVIGNNFSTAEFDAAAVYLTRSTKEWTIVGGNIQEKVINLGTDNIITGMNQSASDVPLGNRIRDILPQMNHLMK